jgi:hypothetical protein
MPQAFLGLGIVKQIAEDKTKLATKAIRTT